MDSDTAPKSFPMIVGQTDRDAISVRDALGIATHLMEADEVIE